MESSDFFLLLLLSCLYKCNRIKSNTSGSSDIYFVNIYQMSIAKMCAGEVYYGNSFRVMFFCR